MEDKSQSLGSEEVMLEVRASRLRVAASPSFPPTAVDPVMPTEVDMESASEVAGGGDGIHLFCSSRK